MRKYHLPHVLVSSIAVMLTLALSGCYKHVIRVEGMGSDRYNTYEPHYRLDGDENTLTTRKMVPTKLVKPK